MIRSGTNGRPARWRDGALSRVALIVALGWLAGETSLPGAAPSTRAASPLDRVEQIRALKPAEAGLRPKARIEGVVTFSDAVNSLLFIQDATGGIRVSLREGQELPVVGELVVAKGRVEPDSARPYLGAAILTRIKAQALPQALPRTIKQILTGSADSQLVEVRGVIRSVTPMPGRTKLELVSEGQRVAVWELGPDPTVAARDRLMDAQVRVRGVSDSRAGGTGLAPAVQLWAAGAGSLVVETAGPANLFALPINSIASLTNELTTPPNRVRIQGTLQGGQGGSFVIRDATGSARVFGASSAALQAGDRLDVAGYVGTNRDPVVIEDAVARPLAAGAPPVSGGGTADALPVLIEASQVRALSAKEAERGYPIRLRGVVTYADQPWTLLFVQDASGGIFVQSKNGDPLPAAGQVIEVTGFSGEGDFAPVVVAAKIRALETGAMPEATEVSFDALMTGRQDSQWVSLTGVIRSVTPDTARLILDISAQGRRIKAYVPGANLAIPSDWVDAKVRVLGACGSLFDAKRRWQGVQLFVPGEAFVQVLEPGAADPYSLPLESIESLLRFDLNERFGHRKKVRGVVTFQQPGHGLYLHGPTGNIYVATEQTDPLRPGDEIEAVGFPSLGSFSPIVEDAVFRRLNSGPAPAPTPRAADSILQSIPDGELIALDGYVLNRLESETEYVLVLQSGATTFNAHLPKPTAAVLSSGLVKGSRAQVTGVCAIVPDDDRTPVSFRVMLRSAADVVVLEHPAWWTWKRTVTALASMGLTILAGAGWVGGLRRQVRVQTEKMRADLLREAALEARFRALVDNATDMVYTHDLAGNLTSLNRAGETILGCARERWHGSNIASFLRPAQQEIARRMMERKRTEGYHTAYELEINTASGGVRVMEISSWLVSRGGELSEIQGIARDITERKRMEDRLRQSEALYLSLVENLPQGIFRKDLAGRFTFANQRFCRLVGLPMERVLGSTDAELYPPPLAEKHREDDRRVIRAGASLETVEENPLPGGGAIYAQVIKTPLFDAHEGVAGTQGIVWDITDRKLAEEALLRAEREYREIFDNCLEGIYRSTPGGQFLTVNPALARMIGYATPEEMIASIQNIGRQLYADPADQAKFIRLESEQGVVRALECQYVRNGGATIWVSLNGRGVRDQANAVLYYEGTVEDITERKRLEAQLLRVQRLDGIGTLASGIAHDLNNALSPVLMAAHMLRLKYHDPEDIDLLRLMEASAQRGAAMVSQILTFARGSSNQRVTVGLRYVVKDLLAMMEQTFPKTIQIEDQVPKGVWPVQGDPTQLHQVLLNLCVNARDAMPTGGKLTLTAEQIVLDERSARLWPEAKPGPYTVLSVIDTGAGMTPAIQERIFEPFFTTKEAGKGTGLGLSTVRGIVKGHRGFLTLDSAPGAGAHFRVYLPAQPPADANAVPALNPPSPSGNGECILLVDDEAAIRGSTQTVLEAFGYHTLTAKNGAEAVTVCADHLDKIQLMLTDMMMPIMGGAATILAVRKVSPAIKIIAMSGLGFEADGPQPPPDGADAVLAKPFTADALLRAVRAQLAGAPR